MLRNFIRTILIVLPYFALLLGLVFDCPALQSQAVSISTYHYEDAPKIVCGKWNRISSVAKNSALEGVVGISTNDAWAVGFMEISSNPTNLQPFMMHWDGIQWNSVPSPVLSGLFNELYGVAAISTSDVWTVGTESEYSQALIERWDGSSWSVVPSPTIGNASDLFSVTNIPGTNQLWAVGNYSSNNVNYALIDYWDGTQWSAIPSPPVNSNNSALQSVTAFSTTDAWAVGWFENAGVVQTLIEHWDGTSWSVVPSPNTSPYTDILFSVTPVPNTNQLWAVGYHDGVKFERTLIEYWDGSSWSVVPSANYVGTNLLLGTLAIASNDIWSVGYHAFHNTSGSIIEHWDGAQWSIISQPASALRRSSLRGISAVPNQTEIWAVGLYYTPSNQMYHPLTLLYC